MWKITFFFAQFNSTWTETYYADGGQSYSTVVSGAQAVAIARVGLNAPQCVLTAIRIVNLNQVRLSTFIPPGTFASTGTFAYMPATDPDQDSAPMFVALQVKFFGSLNTSSCRRYLSGLPEGIFSSKSGGRNVAPLGLMLNALTNFVLTLAVNSWKFRYTNQAGKQLASNPLTSVQFPGEIGFSFGQQMVAQVAGQPIQMLFRGFRRVNNRQPGIGGVYTIDPQSPGITAGVAPYTYYLRNTSNVTPGNITGSGYGVQLLYAYAGFSTGAGPAGTGFTVLNGTHRKRGVSALAPRGRLRTR